jgi:hypothetical protein
MDARFYAKKITTRFVVFFSLCFGAFIRLLMDFHVLFQADMRLFRSIIDDEYRIDWIVDNLPGAMRNDE